MNCDVWLNGALLGNHPYGYTEFAFDMTPQLKGRKEHRRRARSTTPAATAAGTRAPASFARCGSAWMAICASPRTASTVTTPEVSKEAALVNMEVAAESGAAASKRANVRVRLVDSTGAVAGESQAPVTVPADAQCDRNVQSP